MERFRRQLGVVPIMVRVSADCVGTLATPAHCECRWTEFSVPPQRHDSRPAGQTQRRAQRGDYIVLAVVLSQAHFAGRCLQLGGYFIINGIEKIMRMIVVPRRNHVSLLHRPPGTVACRSREASLVGSALASFVRRTRTARSISQNTPPCCAASALVRILPDSPCVRALPSFPLLLVQTNRARR